MTTIEPIQVTTANRFRLAICCALVAGMIAGAAIVLHFNRPVEIIVDPNEPVMIAACKLPDTNGAVTIFTMRDNRIECGRYR